MFKKKVKKYKSTVERNVDDLLPKQSSPLDLRSNREKISNSNLIALRNEAKMNYSLGGREEDSTSIDMDVFPSEFQLQNFEKDPISALFMFYNLSGSQLDVNGSAARMKDYFAYHPIHKYLKMCDTKDSVMKELYSSCVYSECPILGRGSPRGKPF